MPGTSFRNDHPRRVRCPVQRGPTSVGCLGPGSAARGQHGLGQHGRPLASHPSEWPGDGGGGRKGTRPSITWGWGFDFPFPVSHLDPPRGGSRSPCQVGRGDGSLDVDLVFFETREDPKAPTVLAFVEQIRRATAPRLDSWTRRTATSTHTRKVDASRGGLTFAGRDRRGRR